MMKTERARVKLVLSEITHFRLVKLPPGPI